jgi:Fur family ferric uptake transcriptional regulator
MPIAKEDEARLLLSAAGCRVTAPRRAVLESFQQAHEHLEADEILRRARRRHPALGRATVYRALDLLTELGVVRPLRSRGGKTCFMRIGRGHDHLVCSRCDSVAEVAVSDVERIGRRLAKRAGFVIQSHLLEFYGVCPDCRAKEPR